MADQSGETWFVLCPGLRLEGDPVEVADHVQIVPLSGTISTFDCAKLGTVGFREWSLLGSLLPACRVEIVSEPPDVSGFDSLNRAWLATAMLVLRGHTAFMPVAASAYSWDLAVGVVGTIDQRPTEERELPPFKGGLIEYHQRVRTGAEPRALTAEDASWIRPRFEGFNRLTTSDTAFEFGLRSATDWRFERDDRAALIRVWAGIEAYFPVRGELKNRLATYSAVVTEAQGQDREAAYERIRGLYDRRSDAVHGAEMEADELKDSLSASREVLNALLITAAELGSRPSIAQVNSALFTGAPLGDEALN